MHRTLKNIIVTDDMKKRIRELNQSVINDKEYLSKISKLSCILQKESYIKAGNTTEF